MCTDERLSAVYSRKFYYRIFSLPEDSGDDGQKIDFLPDIIYIIADDDKLDGIPIDEASGLCSGISNIDILNMYKKYMIANGYSEMWLNNPYSGI